MIDRVVLHVGTPDETAIELRFGAAPQPYEVEVTFPKKSFDALVFAFNSREAAVSTFGACVAQAVFLRRA